MNRTRRTLAVYTEVIDRMGMESSIRDNTITLHPADGVSFTIVVEESDPEFMWLGAVVDGEKVPISRLALLEICNRANRDLKGAKCIVDGDGDVVIQVDNLMAGTDCIPTVEDALGILPRTLHMLITGIGRITDDLRFAAIVDQAADGKGEEA